MPLHPEVLVLPRTVALNLTKVTTSLLELSSRKTIDKRTFTLTVYSTLRGDIADLVEILYAGMHGGGDLFDFGSGWDSPNVTGKLWFENLDVVYHGPFQYQDKAVHSASINFDAVSTRSG